MVVKDSKKAVSVAEGRKGGVFYCGCCNARIVYKSRSEVALCFYCLAMWAWEDKGEEPEFWRFLGYEIMPKEQREPKQ